ncbi:hypothetical protein BDZ91DRAFT_724827 [Kalaharituber pfeilii]|nr:hypothetical protein BDZ91DRAFT_724827 [Kalaharituber pfeilii]
MQMRMRQLHAMGSLVGSLAPSGWHCDEKGREEWMNAIGRRNEEEMKRDIFSNGLRKIYMRLGMMRVSMQESSYEKGRRNVPS